MYGIKQYTQWNNISKIQTIMSMQLLLPVTHLICQITDTLHSQIFNFRKLEYKSNWKILIKIIDQMEEKQTDKTHLHLSAMQGILEKGGNLFIQVMRIYDRITVSSNKFKILSDMYLVHLTQNDRQSADIFQTQIKSC